jgi:hypothetical protein
MMCTLVLAGCGAPAVSDHAPAASIEQGAPAPPVLASEERPLEHLPPDAAIYALARPSAILNFVGSRPEAAILLDNFKLQSLEEGGMDIARHVAFAGPFMDTDAANRAFDAFESEIQRGTTVEQAIARAPRERGWRGRIVVPLKRASALDNLAGLVPGLEVVRCPAPACAPGANSMVLGEDVRAAITLESDTALVDVAIDAKGDTPALGRGGPSGGCRDLDQGAALAVCINPDRLAPVATAHARMKVIDAITMSGSLTRAQLTKLLATGKAEADVAKRLSDRGAGLVTDFDLAIGLGGNTIEGRVSWGLTPEFKQRVERVISAPMQFKSFSELRASALDPLHRDLASDPAIAAPFGAQGMEQEMQNGGFTTLVMAAVRGWPILIASRDYAKLAAALDEPVPELKDLRLELAMQGERLAFRWQLTLP